MRSVGRLAPIGYLLALAALFAWGLQDDGADDVIAVVPVVVVLQAAFVAVVGLRPAGAPIPPGRLAVAAVAAGSLAAAGSVCAALPFLEFVEATLDRAPPPTVELALGAVFLVLAALWTRALWRRGRREPRRRALGLLLGVVSALGALDVVAGLAGGALVKALHPGEFLSGILGGVAALTGLLLLAWTAGPWLAVLLLVRDDGPPAGGG